MRFKVDENLPVEAVESLRVAGHDALSIHDQQMVGSLDPHVAFVCQSEGRALVTLDLDFSDIRAYPRLSAWRLPWHHCASAAQPSETNRAPVTRSIDSAADNGTTAGQFMDRAGNGTANQRRLEKCRNSTGLRSIPT